MDERKYGDESVVTPEHLEAGAFRWENGELKKIPVSEATKNPEEKPSPEEVKEVAKALGEFLAQSEAEKAAKEAAIEKDQPKSSPQKMEEGALKELVKEVGQPISAGETPAKPEVRAEEPVQEQKSVPEKPRTPEESMQALLAARTLEEFYKELDRMEAANETIQIEDASFSGTFIRDKIVNQARGVIDSGEPLKNAAPFIERIPTGPLRDKIEQILKVPGLIESVKKAEEAYSK